MSSEMCNDLHRVGTETARLDQDRDRFENTLDVSNGNI